MKLSGQTRPLLTGTVCCFRPRSRIHATHDPKRRLTVTAVHFHFIDQAGHRWRPEERLLPRAVKQISDVQLFERCTRRMEHLDTLPGGRAEAEAYLTAMLIGLRAERIEPPADESPLATAEQTIRQQPGEVESIASLARQCGMSVEHFSRSFRRAFGVSAHDLLIDSRVDRAKQMLEHNQLQVQQVAELLGYRDVFFFSRQFKARTGKTPTQWRAASGPSPPGRG